MLRSFQEKLSVFDVLLLSCDGTNIHAPFSHVCPRMDSRERERERDKTRNLAFSPGVLCPQSRQFDGASCRPVTRDSIRAVSFKLVLLASYSAIRRMSLPAIANVAGVSSMLAFFSSSLHAEPISFRLSRTPFRSDDTGPSHL